MRATSILKGTFFKVCFFLIIICVSSCKKNNPIETTLKKNETFAKNEKEETEAFFFIAVANVSKTIISKSKIAQQKSSESSIVILSLKIETQQNRLLEDINDLANKRLIIISEIDAAHRRDTYNLVNVNAFDFDAVYLNSMKEYLEEQIELLESISKQTNDKTILKLVLTYLPEQFDLLRETEQNLKKEIK
ncbi:hypothetical protein BOW57_07360 [Flavobacterium sp. YO64]|nr:hypothetical protein BOW57_07360 [Flavobacterium sp. YO64]